MIAIIGAAFLFLSVGGSLVFAQGGDESQMDQKDTTIQPAAKSGVYKDVKGQLEKMQKARAEKDRLSDKMKQINQDVSGVKSKH